jgi:putative transposase
MARKLRIEYAGAIYHVTVRSNGEAALFVDDADRRYLLGRLGEAAKTHQVRIYLFCLMSNHIHLLVETPRGNLGRFMQSVLTGYGVYFNRRHHSHGHVTQGRYGARLVEGDAYLLKLSRYVHLNPVMIESMRTRPMSERRQALRRYQWSSYPSYIGRVAPNDFVVYDPVLSLVSGSRVRKERMKRYGQFVEAGLAGDDEELKVALVRSAHGIGSAEFCEDIEDQYRDLVSRRRQREDISFRRVVCRVSPQRVLDVVARAFSVERDELLRRRRDCRYRATAARMLCRFSGLTQREAARELGLRTGVAVSWQNRRLTQLLESDAKLSGIVQRIVKRLEKDQA